MNIFVREKIFISTQQDVIKKIFHTHENLTIIHQDDIIDQDEGIFYFAGLEIDHYNIENIKKIKNRGLIIMQENYCFHTCDWFLDKLMALSELFDDDKVLVIVQNIKDKEVMQEIFPRAIIEVKNFWLDEFFTEEYTRKRLNIPSKMNIDHVENKLFSMFVKRYDIKRLEIYSLLIKHNLLKDFHFSISNWLSNGQSENKDNIIKHIQDSDVITNKEYMIQWIDGLPYELAKTNSMGVDCAYPDTLEYYFNKSQIHIVLESNPYYSSHQNISEKTYKAFFYKKPFLLICHPFQLQNLRREGYKTFSKVFDESYDYIENYQERLDFIINEMKRLQSLSDTEKSQIYDYCNNIVEHNYNNLIDQLHTNNVDSSVTIDKVIKNMKAM